jgi:hypothetical protein
VTDRPLTCAQFEEQAEELALGLLEEPDRTILAAHAAQCARCQARLDGLVAVADGLLLMAPEVEPPPGFESRVLARLAAPAPARSTHRAVPWWVAGAAAVAALTLGIVAAVAVTDDAPLAAASRSGTIKTPEGIEVGTVELVEEPTPHVLIAVPDPRPVPGYRTCELQRADGSWVEVGSWTADGIASGVWASGIADELLTAVAMRVVSEDGTVLASATVG